MSASKLTTMQIKEIQEKYAAGMTQRALAAEYGVSQALIQKRCGGPYRSYKSKKIVYSGLENWMQENAISIRKMTELSGMNYVALYYILIGKNDPNKKSIDRILKATGLTYEQAFGGKNE